VKTTLSLLAVAAATLLSANSLFAQYAPSIGPGEALPEELKVLDRFPEEITYEGIRLHDFELDPKQGGIVTAGARIALRFKYKVEEPRKVFFGAMPLTGDKPSGGYQPFELQGKEGKGEVGLFYHGTMGYGAAPPPPPTTLSELKASYQQIDGIELMLYGAVKKQAKFRAPLSYEVMPLAMFTAKDKFYLDRLIQEVISLRQRVQDLEAAGK
jgi:hypothetical protein